MEAIETTTTKKSKRRRGNGEGCIYFREDRQLWAGRISAFDPKTGARKRITVYGQTRKECSEKMDARRADKRDGKLVMPNKETVETWLTRWLADVVKLQQRASTHASYAQVVRLHILPQFGSLRLSQLTTEHVQTLYADMARNGKSARLQEMAHAILHKALKVARKRRLVAVNVCEDVERPKPEDHEISPLTPEQSIQFISAARGQRLETLFIVAITTGARQGELFALRWADVDLENGTASIRRTVVEIDGVFVENPPKTAKGRRLLKLSPMAVQSLREHRKRMLVEGFASSDHIVFCDERGGFLRRQNVSRRTLANILKAAELPKTTRFHDLRHTAATLRFKNGDNPKLVQEALGYSKVGITLDIYSHVLPSMQDESAERVDRLIGFGSAPGGATVVPQEGVRTAAG